MHKKKGVIRWFSSSLRRKMIVYFLAVTLVPLLISTWITYGKFSSEIKKTYIKNNQALINQLSEQSEEYLLGWEKSALSFINSYEIFAEFETGEERYAKNDERMHQLSLFLYQDNDIDSIMFYRPISSEAYYVDESMLLTVYDGKEIEKMPSYGRKTGTFRMGWIQPTHLSDEYPESMHINNNHAVITVHWNFSRNLLSRIYGVLDVNYKTDKLDRLLGKAMTNDQEGVMLLDQKGERFYATPDYELFDDTEIWQKQLEGRGGSGSFLYRAEDGRSWLVVFAISGKMGNRLIKAIPADVLTAQAKETRNFNVLWLSAVALAVTLVSFMMSMRITGPLSRLEKSMKLAGEGDFTSYSQIVTDDEVGRMSLSFNKMIKRIDSLVNEKYRIELEHRMSQLKALQAQINPHFLYNTLQSFGSVALEAGLKDLYRMTVALSNMMRYSIRAETEPIMLEDELRHAEKYLDIQKFRYEDRLEFEIQIDAGVEQLPIPKLTLQPLVENAILHGIESKKGVGRIVVRAIKEPSHIRISIADNGTGISEERLRQILDGLHSGEMQHAERGVGLNNVYQRISMMYGDSFDIEIHSISGQGTEVVLLFSLPKYHNTEDGQQEE
ncbi:sensor histidine kinase [Cohnella sp. GCM10020058]|uniref:cache domain-containing sensor histidine kinase n=1 Tax=Cohnella sp. GCM10020058 TaxID=3317330 RepID=UPI00362AFCA5